jgi:hypothetical protein
LLSINLCQSLQAANLDDDIHIAETMLSRIQEKRASIRHVPLYIGIAASLLLA